MPDLTATTEKSEAQFAEFVDALAADPARHAWLPDLLREDSPFYNQRSAAAISRMRGWVLLALARTGVSNRELPFLLEEFDTGTDAYLVAAAARALRSYKKPSSEFAPFVIRALSNVRDEPLSFESYGDYATSATDTTPVRELFAVLAWLGPHACTALPSLASMRAQPGRLSKKMLGELDRTVAAIVGDTRADEVETDGCCNLRDDLGQKWRSFQGREDMDAVVSVVFEDQDGTRVRYQDFFKGNPSIVVFFYTRCDNPWKCSLTVTKLARVQRLLKERGIADQIQTAAITYDPDFDLPERLHSYGLDRGVHFDSHHRMLGATEGFAALRNHFKLGVNFIESLVNRHRIELYIVDGRGRVAVSFERLHWDELQVVNRATEVLRENPRPRFAARSWFSGLGKTATAIFGPLLSIGWAFFPTCPACWAAYLSVVGMVGIRQIPYPSRMQPVFMALMLVNVVSVWFRARAIRDMGGFYFVFAGTLAIILAETVIGGGNVAALGVALMCTGSLWNAVGRRYLQSYVQRIRVLSRDVTSS